MTKINWHEFTQENIGQWPKSVKVSVLLALGIFILAAGYWLIIHGRFTTYQQLLQEEMNLKATFETKQRQASSLADYRQQSRILHDNFTIMLKQLPENNEMPGLLPDISNAAVAAGLKVALFSPQPDVVHDFYVVLPIKISLVGSYSQLAAFLRQIATMNLLLTVQDFNVERSFSSEHGRDELVMNLTIQTYRYHPS